MARLEQSGMVVELIGKRRDRAYAFSDCIAAPQDEDRGWPHYRPSLGTVFQSAGSAADNPGARLQRPTGDI